MVGAILMTGYLGGATATHVRRGSHGFSRWFLGCWFGWVWLCGILKCGQRLGLVSEVTPYLNFDRNCEEAMRFYADCLEAEVNLRLEGRRVMQAYVTKGSLTIMAFGCPPGMAMQPGNNFYICLECESAAEQDRVFAALGEGGTVTMPL